MDLTSTILTLQSLIETCRDGENGYWTAANMVATPELRGMFESLAEQRVGFVGELKRAAESLGQEITPPDGSVAAELHRNWISFKATFTSGKPETVLHECERGENAAIEDFDEALKADLPDELRQMVEAQRSEIRRALSKIHGLLEHESHGHGSIAA